MGSEILEISSDEENWRETEDDGWNRRTPFVTMIKPSSKRSAKKMEDDDDDDDCVILDGDPDKPDAAENAINDSDDLVVVGSKGQVACRDFPHPRHLCANYEFATTPHEKHCGKCHCYVCDELAPCVSWGDGTGILDHCHATDKTKYWKQERQILKNANIAPEATPKASPRLTDFYSIPSCSTTGASPRLTDFYSIPSCSTTGDYGADRNPNPVVQCAPNSQNKNTHQNTGLHHIGGTSTTFKRPCSSVLTANGSAYERYSQIYLTQANLQGSQSCGQLPSTSNEYMRPTTLLDSVNDVTVNPLPFQPSSLYLPESSQSFDHSQFHHNVCEATKLPQLNSGDFLQNSVPSQTPQTSSLYKGDNFVSNSLPYSPQAAACESNSTEDSTFHLRDSNLQINGLKVPNFDSNWRSSHSRLFLQNSLLSQPQTSSQYKGDNSVSKSLSNPQRATSCESNSYMDSTSRIPDANLQINCSQVPNFDSNWRSSNSSPFLLNTFPSQPQTSSQHKGDKSVSNSLSYSQPATACESNSNVNSTFHIQNANLQINGSKVPNFDSNWRASNSPPFFLNSLPSQPQTSSQHKGDNSVSNSLLYSQPAAACESNLYDDSSLGIRDANLQMNSLKAPNFDSNWRSINSSAFLQNPLPSQFQPQTSCPHKGDNAFSNSVSYSQPATACGSNSYVDSTFHIGDSNQQINGLNVPNSDFNWRSNNNNQINLQTSSDLPQLNSSTFLRNPLPSEPQTSSQNKGDNSFLYSQPTAACESNLYVDSTFHTQDANPQINGLEVSPLDSNWRSSNSNQRNQQSGSDISRQGHVRRRQVYDPRFSSGTGLSSSSLGFDTEPWMLDESLCPMSPELDVYPHLFL